MYLHFLHVLMLCHKIYTITKLIVVTIPGFVTVPRGRARSEFRLDARSAGVGILPHTLSMKCGDRGHTLAERMQFLSLSLLHESGAHSPPSLSPH